ncbi:MAG: ABC transporter permease [Bryobacteraceae bacterium]
MLRAALSRILGTFRRRRLDEEFDDEVRSHLEMLEERFIARGMDPGEAFHAARREFGGVTQVKQDLRERRALPAISMLVEDVRHAFRQLGKAKGFTASVALTLALGIGASTAVFAVLNAVVLRPLPFAEPDRLMAFRSMDRRGTPRPTQLSYPDFFDFRKQNRVFEHLACYRDAGFTLTDSLPAIQVIGEIVSWDLFPTLGVQPELGRGFLPEEEKPGTHVVVLSHALWKSRFAGDKGILGRAIRINGILFTVVGVAPAGFQFPADAPAVELWVTLSEDVTASDQRGGRMLEAIGRLKPGVSAEQAQAQMDLVAGALAQQYPGNKNYAGTLVLPELERLTGSSVKPLLILLGAVAMLLLIACANVVNLLLARNTERGREFALRTALGASRPAIVRQVLIESLALGLLGTAGGVLLALGALNAVLPLAGESIPRVSQASIDGRVLAFSIVMAVLTSVLFSLAPAFQAAGADPAGALKESARSIARGHDRFRSALVVVQITLGLVLLVGAELLMASFLHLVQRDPGFRADHLLTFDIGLPEAQYNVARQTAFCDRLIEQLRAIPGVRAAATGRPLPLQGHQMRIAFDIEERPAAVPDRPRSDTAIVTPGYFGAMGIPLLKGRDFSEGDDAGAPPVLVVNQAFARKYFPAEDVIGKRIQPGAGQPPTPMREIVGVVGDAKQAELGADSDPIYYFPYKQLPWGIGTIVLRTAVPPLEVESAARAALASLDRQAAMHQIRTGEDLSARVIARMQFLIVLMGSFAAVALLLTGAGLYGVLSYAVARRRGEIGVRIALGAGRKEVLGLVFRQAMQLVAAGLILGLASAVAVGRLLETTMFGIRPGDPVILVGACCVLVITGMAAAYVPAARAASVDPMQALRSE